MGIKDSRFQTASHSVASLIFIPAETLCLLSEERKKKRRETEWRAKNKKAENPGIPGLRGDTTAGGGAEGTVSSANGIKLCQRAADGDRVTERALGKQRDTKRGKTPAKTQVQGKQAEGRPCSSSSKSRRNPPLHQKLFQLKSIILRWHIYHDDIWSIGENFGNGGAGDGGDMFSLSSL